MISEKLVRVTSASKRVLFARDGGRIEFAPGMKRLQFLRFAFEGTRENELFLTNSCLPEKAKFRNSEGAAAGIWVDLEGILRRDNADLA